MTMREKIWTVVGLLCGLLVAAELQRLGVSPGVIEAGVMVSFLVMTILILRKSIFYP
jgi:hypothetical protein